MINKISKMLLSQLNQIFISLILEKIFKSHKTIKQIQSQFSKVNLMYRSNKMKFKNQCNKQINSSTTKFRKISHNQ